MTRIAFKMRGPIFSVSTFSEFIQISHPFPPLSSIIGALILTTLSENKIQDLIGILNLEKVSEREIRKKLAEELKIYYGITTPISKNRFLLRKIKQIQESKKKKVVEVKKDALLREYVLFNEIYLIFESKNGKLINFLKNIIPKIYRIGDTESYVSFIEEKIDQISCSNQDAFLLSVPLNNLNNITENYLIFPFSILTFNYDKIIDDRKIELSINYALFLKERIVKNCTVLFPKTKLISNNFVFNVGTAKFVFPEGWKSE